MKVKTLLVALSIIFLIIMTSSVSAVEYNSLKESDKKINLQKNYNPDILKAEIQERLNTLINKDVSFKTMFNDEESDDPDGPLEGGLDDTSDFVALFWGLLNAIGFLPYFIKLIFKHENAFEFFAGIFGTLDISFQVLMNFGEAFDIIEYTMDGS